MRPPLGFASIQYANPENYISTTHVDSALFAILKLFQIKAAILFPASKLHSLRYCWLPSHTKSSSNVLRINSDVMLCCLRRQVNWPYMRLAEIAPLDPPSRKPHPRTKHGVDRTTGCRDMAIWNFRNERSVVGRRSVGRSSIYTYLHWSHILLFAILGTQRARSKNRSRKK